MPKIPDFLVFDYAEKKDVTVNYKSPLSVALGATYSNTRKTKTVYATVEYFKGLDVYRMVSAEENTDMISGEIGEMLAEDKNH